MPVDLSHSRFGAGHRDPLGPIAAWHCPACGQQNDGRRVEQGCEHCGAGDPNQARAGQTARAHVMTAEDLRPTVPDTQRLGDTVARSVPAPRALEAVRILRLLEYRILPGQDATEVLRRSLVGTLQFPWGTLTGTIVDSCDTNQEDRLRLAKLQPGVWLGNPLYHQHPLLRGMVTPSGVLALDRSSAVLSTSAIPPRPQEPAMPQTGPPFTAADEQIAQLLEQLGGYRLCHTLSLALANLAIELEGNAEPEKFLTPAECSRLANACLQQVPEDWQGEQTEEPPPPPGGDEVARQRIAEIQQGSTPTASPWKDPKEGGMKL